jgi:predicted transcriptional regulator
MEFETITKPEGTQNAKVNQKNQWLEEMKKKMKEDQNLKSLPTLEKDAEEILHQEVLVILGKEMLNKLKDIFDKCKERGKEHIDEVETTELIASIAEDTYFEKNLERNVRENVDGVKETLENLLHRVL